MPWTERIFTQPTIEPVSLTEAKAHLRVFDTADDDYISTLISVARTQAEQRTGRALITQTWDWYSASPFMHTWSHVRDFYLSHSFARNIELPRGPVTLIDKIEVLDAHGTATLVDPAEYIADTISEPAVITITGTLPDGRLHIRYTAGAETAADVPTPIKQAILLLVADFFENRNNRIYLCQYCLLCNPN